MAVGSGSLSSEKMCLTPFSMPSPLEGEGSGEGDPLKMKKRSDKEPSEREEDRLLVRFAEDRERFFDRRKALTHEQVWPHCKRQHR